MAAYNNASLLQAELLYTSSTLCQKIIYVLFHSEAFIALSNYYLLIRILEAAIYCQPACYSLFASSEETQTLYNLNITYDYAILCFF